MSRKQASAVSARTRKRPARRRSKYPGDLEPIGAEILEKYPGKHIVYSDLEQRVIGVGDTLEEAFRQAEASGAPEPWHSTYSDPPDIDGYVF